MLLRMERIFVSMQAWHVFIIIYYLFILQIYGVVSVMQKNAWNVMFVELELPTLVNTLNCQGTRTDHNIYQ